MDWTLVIALGGLGLATYSTLLVPLYRKYVVKPKLRIHKSGYLQLLFGPFGPGLQMVGTVQAVNAQQFLSVLEAIVTHESTGERHALVWRLMFPDVFVREPGTTAKTDMPVGVMVNPQQAFRFQTFFNSPEIEDGVIRAIQKRLTTDWLDTINLYVMGLQHQRPESLQQAIEEAGITRQRLFIDFMGTETFAWAKQQLEGTFFWRPGRYSLTIRATTAEPDNVFDEHWRFELTEEHLESLRFNTDFTIGALAGLPEMIYSGATVDILPPDK